MSGVSAACADRTDCRTPLDLVFLVDDSSSILPSEWPDVQQFLVNTTRLFEVSSSDTRIGIVQYSTMANVIYRLTDFQSQRSVTGAINRMQHNGGSTNLAAAMRLAFSQVFVPAPRAGAAKVPYSRVVSFMSLQQATNDCFRTGAVAHSSIKKQERWTSLIESD